MTNANLIVPGCLAAVLAAGCSVLMEPDSLKPAAKSGGGDGAVGGKGVGGTGAKAGATNSASGGVGATSAAGSTGTATGGSTLAGSGGSSAGAASTTGGASSAGAVNNAGAPAAGGLASGGANTGGVAPSGGSAGAAGSCTGEGCPCVGSATAACNDCGTRSCNATTHLWGPCIAAQTPAATQCGSASVLQTCSADGKWAPTTCVNPDAAHCTSNCVKGASSSSCVVTAADADNDTYGTKLCATAPGTDCDDAKPAIHPGATEVCDGVDNDCNGKADLNDGLPLGGTAQVQTGHSGIALAWSPTMSRFMMVSSWSEGNGIFSGSLSTSGISAWSEASTNVAGFATYYSPSIVWSPTLGMFALTYSLGWRGGSGSNFELMSDVGTSSGGYALGTGSDTTNPSVALRTAGDLVLVFHDQSNTYVGRYISGSSPSINATLTGEYAMAPKIATSGDLSATIYQINSTHTINWVRVNASLAAGAPAQLTSSGQNPDIASVANGYAMGWSTASGFDYQAVSSADGSVVCGPIHVPFGDGTLDANDGIAIKATQYGTLVLAADEGGRQLHLFRIDASCNVVDDVFVHSTTTTCYHPGIAVGGGYVALSWTETLSTTGAGYVQVMGERLCN